MVVVGVLLALWAAEWAEGDRSMKATLLYLSCVFGLLHAPAQEQEAPAQQFAAYARCELVSGEAIESCRIGYRTVGTLNAARDNAILVPSWFTGTSEEFLDYAGIVRYRPGVRPRLTPSIHIRERLQSRRCSADIGSPSPRSLLCSTGTNVL